MRKRSTRWGLVGQQVSDGTGAPVGQVVDTYPFDGGEVEMVVVRLTGRFGGKRMLAVEDLWTDLFGLRTPFAAWQVEDSPALSGGRHAAEDPYRAASYWRFEEPAASFAAA
ncbi:MAG TPA: PRC-barrel domain-containing protein [Solirubrobacter sp.]|nr:PRC-barrel domain-containing protein [Solirubrobacter sp.]